MSDNYEHADYPHNPGALYDCPACESRCFCQALGYTSQCVFCAIRAEEARAATLALFDVTATLHRDCSDCDEQAFDAAVMARVTGSVGATSKVERDGIVTHSATVARKPKG